MRVEFDPIPDHALELLHESHPLIALRVEQCLDWLEADPVDVRARRRQFSNGLKAMTFTAQAEQWVILWEQLPEGIAVVRFLDTSSSL